MASLPPVVAGAQVYPDECYGSDDHDNHRSQPRVWFAARHSEHLRARGVSRVFSHSRARSPVRWASRSETDSDRASGRANRTGIYDPRRIKDEINVRLGSAPSTLSRCMSPLVARRDGSLVTHQFGRDSSAVQWLLSMQRAGGGLEALI